MRSDRVDLFWGSVWDTYSRAIWSDRAMFEALEETGRGRVPLAISRASKQQAQEIIANDLVMLKILATVMMWRTVTVEQVETITGHVLGPKRMNWLLSSGLISRGRFITDGMNARLPLLLRPSRSEPSDVFEKVLDYRDWLGVTGGLPWRAGSQQDRHNLLATELAIRVAEEELMPCVLGESFAWLAQLFDFVPNDRTWAGDAVLVRGDGLRVVVELTAGTGTMFASKVDRWASLLARDTAKSTVVLFVEARDPTAAANVRQRAKSEILRTIGNAANGTIDRLRNDVPTRMLYMSWPDWFPQDGSVPAELSTLQVQRPTGPKGARFEPASLRDPFDVDGPDGPGWSDVIGSSRLLYGLPHWFSNGPKPDVDPIVCRRAGWDRVPAPALVRPENAKAARVGRKG
ncbi:MAG: hypothetical protein LCH82_12920 [Actinobacteria bacterium]|nr:hypothetical protein [Actinomycetota bacterium]